MRTTREMNKRIWLLFSGLMLCLMGWDVYAIGEGRNSANMHKLVFSIQSNKEEYQVGNKITLKGVLENRSEAVQLINKQFLAKGGEVEYGGWGIALKIINPSNMKIQVGWLYEISGPTTDWFIRLGPGEKYSSDIWGDIGLHCKDEGTYRVTAYYYNFIGESLELNPWIGVIESNTLEIKIKEENR